MKAKHEKDFEERFARLSDRILFALQYALDQEDAAIAELLVKALDMSMTRNTGGGEFIERRDYPPAIEEAMAKLAEIRKKK
jgi:hypothetical protein